MMALRNSLTNRSACMVLTLLLTGSTLGCGRPDTEHVPIRGDRDKGRGGDEYFYPHILSCDLALEESSMRQNEILNFEVTIRNTGATKRLCLSYIQDRPHRWVVHNRKGKKYPHLTHSCGLPGTTAYDGAAVFADIPEGGFIKVQGSLYGALLEEVGKHRVWVSIPHIRCPDTREWGWPDVDEGCWRGLIESNEVEVEVTR